MLLRTDDGIAITAAREDGRVTHHTWRQLKERVRSVAAAMRNAGVTAGDRIAGGAFIVPVHGLEHDKADLKHRYCSCDHELLRCNCYCAGKR